MRKIRAALIGAGQRGTKALAPYAVSHPGEIEFNAVAEPDDYRRQKFAEEYGIPSENCFKSWEELLEQPLLADAVLICTQDRMHFEPTKRALEKGYHVLLEKPMSHEPVETLLMAEYAKKYGRILNICHVLRYTPFFTKIKRMLESGRIGDLVSIQHNENVGFWHQAHSFVRGNWRNAEESSPMILAKSSHDMDILLWLVNSDCTKVSSFGSRKHFRKENAPLAAPLRCLDGCPVSNECPHYAPKIYMEWKGAWQADVLRSAISNDTSHKGLLKALEEGPYGRCVYYCDNDVVDHQIVNLEFENGVTAVFIMSAFTHECDRTLKLMGTRGEIKGHMEKNEIEVIEFNTGNREMIHLSQSSEGHGGGDYGIMKDFVKQVQMGNTESGLTSAEKSAQSHLMAFASETSRLENRIINLKDYIKELRSDQRAMK